jgi:integrase
MGRYRQGTLEKVKTAKGLTWYLRYTDNAGATPRRPRERIGLLAKYPTKSAAWRAAEPILKRLNGPQTARKTFGDLIDLYIEKKMPKRHSTRRGYLSIINAHIRPRWGKVPLEDVRSARVEEWLLAVPVGNYRKGHIHNVMKQLFKTAMHYEWLPLAANPMSTFSIEGSTKRERVPGTITHAQFHAILELLTEPYRTMVVIAQCLGLRVSEIMGLQWHDFDFLAGEVRIRRAVVEAHTGEVKTYHSKKELSLHPRVTGAVQMWRSQTEFTQPEQFVFASPWQAGELPYNSSKIQSDYLRVVGKAIGLDFSLGWHTFRHTYRTLLRKSGAPLDVQRDLMRHADIYMTSKYGGTELDELRVVNDSVVDALFGGKKQ